MLHAPDVIAGPRFVPFNMNCNDSVSWLAVADTTTLPVIAWPEPGESSQTVGVSARIGSVARAADSTAVEADAATKPSATAARFKKSARILRVIAITR